MTTLMRLGLAAVALVLSSASPALAEPINATFAATKACPALQSIKNHTNPGDIQIQAGATYRIVARNKVPATWFQVLVDGASPAARWVEVGCGTADIATGGPPPTAPPTSGDRETHLLALSWQPTFCRAHSDKAECKLETSASPESHQLSLHGLWPQPDGTFYCIDDKSERTRLAGLDGAGKWNDLPEPPMSPETRKRLAAVMPGVASDLERHEWVKHGTCYGGTPDPYFNRAADLVEQLNASPLGALLAANVGKSVKVSDIAEALRKGFGEAAPGALRVKCAGGNISEFEISLAGDVTGAAPLSQLLHPPGKASTCVSGVLTLAQPPH